MRPLSLSLITISWLMSLVTLSTQDRFTGLCPPSYPRSVVYPRTGYCYRVGSQGPCGKFAVLTPDPFAPNYGRCQCKDYGRHDCFGRPLLPYGDTCYYAFSQGPCKKGPLLVRDEYGRVGCKKNPCPIVESRRELFYSEYPKRDFYFSMYGSHKCFKTGTQAFCNPGEKVYFLGTDERPQCLNYDPFNCHNPKVSQGHEQPLIAFGVPYDGI